MAGSVCVIGSANMDLVVRAPRLPAPGETIGGGDFATFPGGKGANQAVAAARMGARVTMVGRVGADTYATDLRKILSREGVDLTALRASAGESTGVAFITVDAQGENTIVVAGGANLRVSTDDIRSVAGLIRSADVLLMQRETPHEAVCEAAALAQGVGRHVVLNAAPAEPLAAELLASIDVLVVNETEAVLVADQWAPDLTAYAERLREMGPGAVVVTQGEAGAIVVDAEGTTTVSSIAIEPVDTVGAGDAFCGALAGMLAEGKALREAVRIGCVAGALAATQAGAIPSLPTRQAVGERLRDH